MFRGTWADAWRANWRLRTANRVLIRLAAWDGSTNEALAAGAGRLVTADREWDGVHTADLFTARRTLAVHATTAASQIRDTRWAALKVKDGLVDAQRRRFGARSSVDRKSPDLQLRLRLLRDRATLLLDSSGLSLDHRGYRLATGAAPVREQLAAACVLAAAWSGKGPVVDPMCGSGTLLAEAGAIALGLAPGRMRHSWAFEKLPGFDPHRWRRIREEPIPPLSQDIQLVGVDRSPQAVTAARSNLERAGLHMRSVLRNGDAFHFKPPAGPGLLVVNPAYGERIGEAQQQWRRLGDLLKQRYTGWTAVVLAGDRDRGKQIGLRPRRRYPVRNGPIDARILVFDLY